MENREDYSEDTIIVPEIVNPVMTPEEGKEVSAIIASFVHSYGEKGEEVPDGDWLLEQFKVSLPDRDEAELTQMRDEIIDGLNQQEEAKKSLETALSRGMSKESWFARECKKATSVMSAMESAKYLQSLDDAVAKANEELWATVMTKGGAVNQNPNLDGFIAEIHHVNTFNAKAVATGSDFRARVLKPGDKGYTKNSVDVVLDNIKTGEKGIQRFQVKYGETAEATNKLYEHGNYQGQQKLVPADQVGKIHGRHTGKIEAPDNVTSKSLTKQEAKELQQKAQSGKLEEHTWNDYAMKDVAAGIAKNAAKAGAMGMVIGAGFELGRQVLNDEEIDGEKLVEEGLKSGADFGVKAAVAGGLKVASEKGILAIIPKGTSSNVVTSIAFLAVENVKVLGEVASGELTPLEGFEKAERVTVSCVYGLAAAAAVCSFLSLGPMTVAGFTVGTIAYLAGSGVAEAVTKGYQKVRRVVVENVIKPAWEKTKEVVHEAWEGVKEIGRALNPFNWF